MTPLSLSKATSMMLPILMDMNPRHNHRHWIYLRRIWAHHHHITKAHPKLQSFLILLPTMIPPKMSRTLQKNTDTAMRLQIRNPIKRCRERMSVDDDDPLLFVKIHWF